MYNPQNKQTKCDLIKNEMIQKKCVFIRMIPCANVQTFLIVTEC